MKKKIVQLMAQVKMLIEKMTGSDSTRNHSSNTNCQANPNKPKTLKKSHRNDGQSKGWSKNEEKRDSIEVSTRYGHAPLPVKIQITNFLVLI